MQPVNLSPSRFCRYDRAEAQLRAVQRNRKTYLNEPEGDQDAYHAWCDQFDLHACTEEISQLLSTDEMVQKLQVVACLIARFLSRSPTAVCPIATPFNNETLFNSVQN